MPVFDHFSKYLVRGYTNSKGEQVPPKWGPQMWSVYGKVLENRTRNTDKLEAWHRRLQAIILRPHPDMDTFVRTLCEEWIFINTNIKKHLAKLETFDVAKKMSMTEKTGSAGLCLTCQSSMVLLNILKQLPGLPR